MAEKMVLRHWPGRDGRGGQKKSLGDIDAVISQFYRSIMEGTGSGIIGAKHREGGYANDRGSDPRRPVVEAMEARVLLAMPTLWTAEGPGGGGATLSPVIAPNGH